MREREHMVFCIVNRQTQLYALHCVAELITATQAIVNQALAMKYLRL